MNDIIPEDVLKTLEEGFGSRFVRRTDGKATPDAHDTVASVFPQSAEEVESLTRLAARHSIPLVARGAGTALYPGKPPRGLTVRFDAMRQIRHPSRRSPSPKGGSARLGAEVLPGEPPGTNPEAGPGVGSR